MATHPNRSKKNPQAKANPTPLEIRRLRETVGKTMKEAAELIYCTEQGWLDWESGARRMHPAFFELFRARVVVGGLLDRAIEAGERGDPELHDLVRMARRSLARS